MPKAGNIEQQGGTMHNVVRFAKFEVQMKGCLSISQGVYKALMDKKETGRGDTSIKLGTMAYLLSPYLQQQKTTYKVVLDWGDRRHYSIMLYLHGKEIAIQPYDEYEAQLFKDLLFEEFFTDSFSIEASPQTMRDAIRKELAKPLSKYLTISERWGLHAFKNLRIYAMYYQQHIPGEEIRLLFNQKYWVFPMRKAVINIPLPPMGKN